ncbi:hypothetical protein NKH89_32570 [Mesorhizobium sp. M0923]|uniref:hypothetical protein n=1 Tax=Mesorhizobium sp. M0923 TaxID=2957028 RepID=UPI003334B68E
MSITELIAERSISRAKCRPKITPPGASLRLKAAAGLGPRFGEVVQRSRPVLSQRLCRQQVGSPELPQEGMIAAAIGWLGRVEEG